MKILTTVTASAGLDVSSTNTDTIKLGSSNTNYQNSLNNNISS
jgi:hypothetical protein